MKNKLKKEALKLAISVQEAILICNALVLHAYASATAVEQRTQQASISAYSLIKGVIVALMVVVVAVCGGILIVGTKRMKDAVLDNLYFIAGGLMLLFFAKDIVDYVEEIFG